MITDIKSLSSPSMDQLSMAKKIANHRGFAVEEKEGEVRIREEAFYTGTAIYAVGSAVPGISGGGVISLAAAKPLFGELTEDIPVGARGDSRQSIHKDLIDQVDERYHQVNGSFGGLVGAGAAGYAATQVPGVIAGIDTIFSAIIAHPVIALSSVGVIATLRYSGATKLEFKEMAKAAIDGDRETIRNILNGITERARQRGIRGNLDKLKDDVLQDGTDAAKSVRSFITSLPGYAGALQGWIETTDRNEKFKTLSDGFDSFKSIFCKDDHVRSGDSYFAKRSAAVGAACAIDVGSNLGMTKGVSLGPINVGPGVLGWATSIPVYGVAGAAAGCGLGSVYSPFLYTEKVEVFYDRKGKFINFLEDEANEGFKDAFLQSIIDDNSTDIFKMYERFCNQLGNSGIEKENPPSIKEFTRWVDLVSRDIKTLKGADNCAKWLAKNIGKKMGIEHANKELDTLNPESRKSLSEKVEIFKKQKKKFFKDLSVEFQQTLSSEEKDSVTSDNDSVTSDNISYDEVKKFLDAKKDELSAELSAEMKTGYYLLQDVYRSTSDNGVLPLNVLYKHFRKNDFSSDNDSVTSDNDSVTSDNDSVTSDNDSVTASLLPKFKTEWLRMN